MAYSDINFFLPQQQYYRNPGDYSKAMKNAALQKAAYLAEMDINMAELDEAKRQFDARLGFDEKSLDKQIGSHERVARLNARTSRKISDRQVRAQNYGTLAQLGLGVGRMATDIWSQTKQRDWDLADTAWAEGIAREMGWFGSGDSVMTDIPTQDFGGQSYGSGVFDLDSIDTSFGLDTFSNSIYEDPLLNYTPDFDFDLGW